jgi:hypothetical protein
MLPFSYVAGILHDQESSLRNNGNGSPLLEYTSEQQWKERTHR